MADPTSQSIETAPRDGRWVLGLVLPDGPTKPFDQPWEVVAWGDRGWHDREYEPVNPARWTPLPDPQPAPTGWKPPEGTIIVEEITGEGWTCNGSPIEVPWRWYVYIELTDGSYDDHREGIHYVTYIEAERRAMKWQVDLGLPIKVTSLDPKVVPFAIVGSVQ
jgi:hypothetical protein